MGAALRTKGRNMLRFSALGSGSSGNAFVIADETGGLIIDLGFSRKELLRRMTLAGVPDHCLCAAAITHEHDDHTKGCRVFCDDLGIPLYASLRTTAMLDRKGKLPHQVRAFEPGTPFLVGDLEVEPFSVQHDAVEPVGFVIRNQEYKIGLATDLGEVNRLALQRLRDCDMLVLESNYDQEMLRNSDRELRLKRRIAGRSGHLDNLAACAALEQLLTPRTRVLLLAHVSRECNTPDIARECCRRKLAALGREDVRIEVIPRDEPLGTFTLRDGEVDFTPGLREGCQA